MEVYNCYIILDQYHNCKVISCFGVQFQGHLNRTRKQSAVIRLDGVAAD